MIKPFKKPWGLQKDGDVWEMAWKTILQRGACNQKIRKVKGHATKEDVEQGRSTIADRHGNDKADKNADEGAEMVYGGGLVKLGQWLAERHSRYVCFMRRVQKMIVAVTSAEKDARKKAHECNKAVLGYDPTKWLKTDAKIRRKGEEQYTYIKLKMPPPAIGVHRYTYCRNLYRDIHKFLANRSWAPTDEESTISGVTWLELFVLFDTSGARTNKGDHIKDPKAKKRADARSKRNGKQQGGRNLGNATVQSTLDAELKRFKAVVRHIAKHEVDKEQGKWFLMEARAKLRRLGPLAIWGNQPAIAAHIDMTKDEIDRITENILKQKIGHNPKVMKRYSEMIRRRSNHEEQSKPEEASPEATQGRETKDNYNKILLKYARVAVGAAVKWKRVKSSKHEEDPEDQAQQDIEEQKPRYTSRKLRCTRCQATQETRRIQLRTIDGFMAIHCKECGKQERAAHNHCTCGVLWHTCELHRIDPKVHESRKGLKKASIGREGKGKGKGKETELSSRRKAPHTHHDQGKEVAAKKTKRKRKADEQIVRHVAFVKSEAPPNEHILARLRLRVERRQQQDYELSERRMIEATLERKGGKEEDWHMKVDGKVTNAFKIADEIKAKDNHTRDTFKLMIQRKIDELRPEIEDRDTVHDDRINMQEQKVMTGSMRMQGAHQPESEESPNDNAKGGWHSTKGSKGIGKGKVRLAGSDATNEAIYRLLALKSK